MFNIAFKVCKYYLSTYSISSKKKIAHCSESHYKKGSNFIDVFQSLLSRFVVACSRPMKQWNDWKKAVPYAIWGFCHYSPRMLLQNGLLDRKKWVFHLACPWLMLWQNHDEFDGPSTVIYLATYPPNCPQKGQDGWDVSPIMRCEHVDV